MRAHLFYHSLVSDWNHGNAHFLRGIVAELLSRGHDVRVWEPRDGWSLVNLQQEQQNCAAIDDFHRIFPQLTSSVYDPARFDAEAVLDGADVVIVHEWTERAVLQHIAEHRVRQGKYCLLFHDTHHRAVSHPDALASMGLERFDGVLAFGASLAEQYRRFGWGRRVWVWHEAADTRVFYPRLGRAEGDLVWIGNWGDDERVRELQEFLLDPVRRLQLSARVYGVRYPPYAHERLARAGITFGGWMPNYRVPEVFAQFRVTVHVPRTPYASLLRGIPTIRPFEALACGMPLVSAPWDDVEGLFRPGDYLMAHGGDEMVQALRAVLNDPDLARSLAERGLETIRARHTCAHRVNELESIVSALMSPDRLARLQEV